MLSATGLWLVKQGEHGKLGVNGNITIIDGAYQRNLTITDQLIALGTSSAAHHAVLGGVPTIGDANPNLELYIKRFRVANNIADIELKSDKILDHRHAARPAPLPARSPSSAASSASRHARPVHAHRRQRRRPTASPPATPRSP